MFCVVPSLFFIRVCQVNQRRQREQHHVQHHQMAAIFNQHTHCLLKNNFCSLIPSQKTLSINNNFSKKLTQKTQIKEFLRNFCKICKCCKIQSFFSLSRELCKNSIIFENFNYVPNHYYYRFTYILYITVFWPE